LFPLNLFCIIFDLQKSSAPLEGARGGAFAEVKSEVNAAGLRITEQENQPMTKTTCY
jgi:hypothetical protein